MRVNWGWELVFVPVFMVAMEGKIIWRFNWFSFYLIRALFLLLLLFTLLIQ